MAVVDVVITPLRFGARTQAAGYQVAATLMHAPLFVALAFATVAFPELARRPADRQTLSGLATHALSFFISVFIVMTTVPSNPFVSSLPADYKEAVHLLPVTAGTRSAYAMITIQTTALRAEGHFRECLVVLIGGGLVAAACMLVASEWGAIGFGAVALVGAWLTVVALALATKRVWPGGQRPPLRPLTIWPMIAVGFVLAQQIPFAWLIAAAVLSTVAAYHGLGRPRGLNASTNEAI